MGVVWGWDWVGMSRGFNFSEVRIFVQNEKIKTIPIFGEKDTFTFLEGIFKCGSNANFYSEYVCKVQKKLSKYCLELYRTAEVENLTPSCLIVFIYFL